MDGDGWYSISFLVPSSQFLERVIPFPSSRPVAQAARRSRAPRAASLREIAAAFSLEAAAYFANNRIPRSINDRSHGPRFGASDWCHIFFRFAVFLIRTKHGEHTRLRDVVDLVNNNTRQQQ